MSESGLSRVESLTGRVATWRARHKARAGSVVAYHVVYDGAVIADIAPRTSTTLDDELGAAAWELAQSVGRPVTADVIALDSAGVEVARLPMRVIPESAREATDQSAVIAALLTQNRELMRLHTELLGGVVGTVRELSTMTTELARTLGRRAREAEAETATATATVQDALALAREQSQGPRSREERALDLMESFARMKLGIGSATATTTEAGDAE